MCSLFFFSSRRRHTRSKRDWSSDVCSSDLWLVGDLANTPIGDGSCQVILNIFSPANYMEFKRVLAPNGLVEKVVPRANYLKELRSEERRVGKECRTW